MKGSLAGLVVLPMTEKKRSPSTEDTHYFSVIERPILAGMLFQVLCRQRQASFLCAYQHFNDIDWE